MCGCLSWVPLLGTWLATQACALDWEWHQWPFGSQAGTQFTEPHQAGQGLYSFNAYCAMPENVVSLYFFQFCSCFWCTSRSSTNYSIIIGIGSGFTLWFPFSLNLNTGLGGHNRKNNTEASFTVFVVYSRVCGLVSNKVKKQKKWKEFYFCVTLQFLKQVF